MASGDLIVDWSELPEDLVVSITRKLSSVLDYISTGQVCKTWSSFALSPHTNLLLPQPPLLMLAESKPKEMMEGQEEEDVFSRGFFGLTGHVCELYLPELYQNRSIGSTGNWLILVNKEQKLRMFNPFTRIQFQLPSQSTLPDQFSNDDDADDDDDEDDVWTPELVRNRFLRKVVLSSTPNLFGTNVKDVIAIAIYGAIKKMAIAKLGDESWMPIPQTIIAEVSIDDIIFFRNCFYFVSRVGMVGFYDVNTNPIKATSVSGEFEDKRYVNKYYLVEWLGELLLVMKYISRSQQIPYYNTQGFQVFKFNFYNKMWEEVKNLGQHSIFVGFSTSVSLLASPSSSVLPNCIYFTDDHSMGYVGNDTEGGRDMGVFDLKDGTITPHYAGVSTSIYSPPLWIIPKSLYQI